MYVVEYKLEGRKVAITDPRNSCRPIDLSWRIWTSPIEKVDQPVKRKDN